MYADGGRVRWDVAVWHPALGLAFEHRLAARCALQKSSVWGRKDLTAPHAIFLVLVRPLTAGVCVCTSFSTHCRGSVPSDPSLLDRLVWDREVPHGSVLAALTECFGEVG